MGTGGEPIQNLFTTEEAKLYMCGGTRRTNKLRSVNELPHPQLSFVLAQTQNDVTFAVCLHIDGDNSLNNASPIVKGISNILLMRVEIPPNILMLSLFMFALN